MEVQIKLSKAQHEILLEYLGSEEAIKPFLELRINQGLQEEVVKAQQQMVKDSLVRAFDELHSGKAHHDARKLFTK